MNFASLDALIDNAVEAILMDDGDYVSKATGVSVPVRLAVSYVDPDLGVRTGNVQTIQLPLISVLGWQRGDQIIFGKTYLIEKRVTQDAGFITFTVRDAAKESV